jgi:hypothetical protein
MKNVNDIESLTVPLWPDAGRLLGYGKEKTYREARKGNIKTLPIPGKQMVPKAWLTKITAAD